MNAQVPLLGPSPIWFRHVAEKVWQVFASYAPWLSRWNWWVGTFLIYLVGCFVLIRYWPRIRQKVVVLLLVGILGAIVFAPPVQWIKMAFLLQETPTFKDYFDTARDLLIGVFMAGFVGAIFAKALEKQSEEEPSPPDTTLTDFFVLIEKSDDLLRLDQSRFLESGFGGLSPGKRRRT